MPQSKLPSLDSDASEKVHGYEMFLNVLKCPEILE